MAALAFNLQGSWDEQPIGHAPKMTSSSTTRPPGFVACFVCQREFGSRSIEIHEPKCLEKWKATNAKLPRSRRQRTPSPPPGHPLHGEAPTEDMTPTPAYTPTSDPDELSTSWSHPGQPPSQPPPGRPRSASFGEVRRKVRPSTATLKKPKVLNVSLRDEVDMSQMTRNMLGHLILTGDGGGGYSDYSSDFTSASPSSSSGGKSDSEGSEGETRQVRPTTRRLPRPSRHIAVPVITAQSSRPSVKTSNLRSFLPRGRRRQLEDIFTGPQNRIKIPEPCMTCGKEQKPERFHSHPLDVPKFSPKGEDKGKGKNLSKLIVTKATAVKYKSRGVDEDKRKGGGGGGGGRGRRSKLKPPSIKVGEKAKIKEEVEEKKPHVPLKKFIKDQKASMGKGANHKDLTVEIYDPDTAALTPRDSSSSPSSSPPASRKAEGRPKAPPPPRNIERIEEDVESKFEPLKGKARDPPPPPPVQRAPGTAPTLLCYICGREFGSRSLGIHQPQCLEKWRRENDKLPKNRQRPEPEPPTHELTQEEWNEYAYKSAQAQLVPCEWCGRTFFPERLEVHQRGCKPPPGAPKKPHKASAGPRPDTSSSNNLNASMVGSKPTVVCYICGREFGSMSIKIHEPQCLKKWNLENEALPNHMKRSEPIKPDLIYNDDGKVDKEAMAEAAWKTHLQQLVACKCGRTFFPDRLLKHQKSCAKA